MPAPCLVSPPVPEATPAKVVLPAPPVVSVLAPSVTVDPAAPVRLPIVSLPVSVRSPVPFRVTAAVSASAVPSALRVAPVPTATTFEAIEPVTFSVPPVTVVAPV